jgi:phosphoserine phosphatase
VDLTMWRDGPTRTAIMEFVGSLPSVAYRRIAVFDNDGTLWCEKPIPIQLDFLMRRFAAQAAADPELRRTEPYRAAYEQDLRWLGKAMVAHYHGDDTGLRLLEAAVARAFDGVPVDEYATLVTRFFADAVHPTLGRPYRECVYAPMVELMRYLEAHGFDCYIASGGDRDFMRPIAGPVYGLAPERVIGSSITLAYHDGTLVYGDAMEFFDDGPTKPVRIWSRIGRRPTIAVGNSNGDVDMLTYTGGDTEPALRILIDHDDADREFAYPDGAEDALAAAAERGWLTVSVRDDWTKVFPAITPA